MQTLILGLKIQVCFDSLMQEASGSYLTNFLVREDSLELFRKDLGFVVGCQELVDLIHDLCEELKGILLLTDVDGLPK